MAGPLDALQLPNLLSPKTDLTSNFKALSDNATTITANPNLFSNNRLSSSITSNIGQAGVLNLQGALDASTKKTAIIYAPVTASNSPNARVSSAPSQDQGGSDNPFAGLLGGPTLIVVGVLALGAVFLLSKSARPTSTTTNFSPGGSHVQAEIGRGSKNVGEGAAL